MLCSREQTPPRCFPASSATSTIRPASRPSRRRATAGPNYRWSRARCACCRPARDVVFPGEHARRGRRRRLSETHPANDRRRRRRAGVVADRRPVRCELLSRRAWGSSSSSAPSRASKQTKMVAQLLQPVWERFVLIEMLSGRLEARDYESDPELYNAVDFRWPAWPSLDPSIDASADESRAAQQVEVPRRDHRRARARYRRR